MARDRAVRAARRAGRAERDRALRRLLRLPTHVTIFSDATLPAFFARQGFETLKLIPGLLPFSMNSRLPKSGLLTRL
jgi:hypothetical protein